MKKLVAVLFSVMILLSGCVNESASDVCMIDSIDVLSQVLEQNSDLQFQQISIYDQDDVSYLVNYNIIDEENQISLENVESAVGCTLIDYDNELIYSINIFEVNENDLENVEQSLNLGEFAKYALGTDLFNNTVLVYDNFVMQLFSESELDTIVTSFDNINFTTYTYDESTAYNETLSIFKARPEENIKVIANIANLFDANLSESFSTLGTESDDNSYMMMNSDTGYMCMVIRCDNNIDDAVVEIKAKYDQFGAPFDTMEYSVSSNFIVMEALGVVTTADSDVE